MKHAPTPRRTFLRQGSLAGLGIAALSPGHLLALDEPPTPPQTAGPFYPKPEIEKQPHFDADLTRLSDDSPVAEGEIQIVRGQVIGLDGNPISNAIVEVWQACLSGRYNHPDDKNSAPIDPNFQYWARMTTNEQGRYRFKTIQPGKYPGRTPHIHYRILAEGHPELVTQMYFENCMDMNRRDGVYKALNAEQQRLVTVAFQAERDEDGIPSGDFRIVLGKS